jgi:glycosyltransferase involved in cell wall biosynthesis
MQSTEDGVASIVSKAPSQSRPATVSREPQAPQLRYALITPARNEQEFIGGTLESVVNQTVLPVKWVIVNDSSTDGTARIAEAYASKYEWIEVITIPKAQDRSFANKVRAFNAGYEKIRSLDVAVIANIDGDVSFDKRYCEYILDKFTGEKDLGVAGSVFTEDGYSSAEDSCEGHRHVAGGCQFFRKECFEAVGGYLSNCVGGIDWIAVTTARMKGWTTRSFRDVSFFHHRHLGTAERSRLSALFSYGEKDYYLGGHPLWELFRVAYRLTGQPYFVGGIALGAGYGWALLRRAHRPVSDELRAFHRKEQMLKLRAIVKRLATLQRVDKFTLLSD